MNPKEIPPAQHLETARKDYPKFNRWVNEFRSKRGKDLPNWPKWCFLPMAAWYSMVSQKHAVDRLSVADIPDVSRLAAIGTWAYGQGIYRFDPDFFPALAKSRLSGDLPSDVLYRLPEWSLYIETPGLTWLGADLHGFWAHLEWDANTERSELRFLLNLSDRLIPMPLHLGQWSILEAFEKSVSVSQKNAVQNSLHIPLEPTDIKEIAKEMTPLVSILLYLCSEEPEIEDERQPGDFPSYPKHKKTKKGRLLFPADKPRIWNVGTEIGRKLRHTSSGGISEGRTKKVHVRDGHWHGYWIGPRKGKRKFIYHWLFPMIVGKK